MKTQQIFFAGDHNPGMHPKVLASLGRVNGGKMSSYREDPESQKMFENFNKLFGQKVKALNFSTGTAANIVGLSALVGPYQSIICPATAHINVYEAGALPRFAGCSLELIPTEDGKIKVSQIEEILEKKPTGNLYPQAKVVYITQPTELGTLWTISELREISAFCKKRGCYLFMDGARIANAVQALNVSIKKMTVDVGVDVLTWGGIKNGGIADVLIFLNQKPAKDVDFIYKQFGQEVAKSRFFAATINALLQNNLWLKNARIANEMAKRLYKKIAQNPKVQVVLPVQTNFVWSLISEKMNKKLSQKFMYYIEPNDITVAKFKEYPHFYRWVTSWATTEKEVDAFAEAINAL
ncbi:MAG: aminotransferase class I/II-fold pyridoxal phosphate-dependent enzyme [Candidatus Gracilibacteria bacterium]